MYTVKPPTPSYEVVALDAASGRIYWTYSYTPADARVCCGRNNKGLAIQGDRLYLATLDSALAQAGARKLAFQLAEAWIEGLLREAAGRGPREARVAELWHNGDATAASDLEMVVDGSRARQPVS